MTAMFEPFAMIEIEGKIVSSDILSTPFLCDLSRCKGICCVEGNAGAPLETDEEELLRTRYENYRSYMTPEGIRAVEEQGFAVIDADGDLTTPLIDGAECAYACREGDVTLCAIEKAWREGRCDFPKPISCHLYPIRIVRFGNGTLGLNYHRWSICRTALKKRKKEGVPMFRMLREPIIRRFGTSFYEALEEAARMLREENE